MRRITVHAVFGLLALGCTVAAAAQALRLWHLQRLNEAIAAAQTLPDRASAQPLQQDAAPAIRLARAGALAHAGAHDAAVKGYLSLVRPGDNDALGRQAQFNLGNMYLRQGVALVDAGGQPAAALPFAELAKQRYRDLLRQTPGDWQARYNLERALRLAPEEQEELAEESNVPAERRRVALRGMEPGDLP